MSNVCGKTLKLPRKIRPRLSSLTKTSRRCEVKLKIYVKFSKSVGRLKRCRKGRHDVKGEPLDDSRRRSAGLLEEKREEKPEEARGPKEHVTMRADQAHIGRLAEYRVPTIRPLCRINHLLELPRILSRPQSHLHQLHLQVCLDFHLVGRLLLPS
jgi:hypothetical protein